ncbi:hypothetical protein E4T56_gene3502 [Termitomyces sp. T112]|nr:hypothetical protein E4T56_gene3502 [Termitomyces sp. T112]
MEEYENARKQVHKVSQDILSFENFIVRAKKYKRNRNEANSAKLICQGAWNFVMKISARAKRRVDIDQQKIDQYTRKVRLERLTKAEFELPDSDDNLVTVTKDFESEVAQPPSPTPSQSGNELNSPFQDPHLKDNPWKTETTLSLQSFASN